MKPKIEIGEMFFDVVCSQFKNYEINQKGTWDLDKSTWDIINETLNSLFYSQF